MYKEVLQHIADVSVWPIVSFFIFFAFFTVILWWAFTVDKSFIADMSNKPLEDDDLDQ